ncbi:MAG: hypothetical protein J2P45_08320 [Candidatus Dormibacteraeota bacterium]|nr:hypothetical protein [Candidatus Dormibacteraeota bacterium]
MSESWGHRVRILPQKERERLVRLQCASGRCTNEATHATSYNYVTGRSGRVSWAERKVCLEHAQRFADKHGVEITEAPAPLHALERALRGGVGDKLVSPPPGGEAAG